MRAPYSRTIFELLCEKAECDPERDAILSAEDRLSYAELEARARRIAGGLRLAGVKRCDRIGLLANNLTAWLEIFFAASALGATVVPFSTWSTASELEFVLTDSGITWLFTIDEFGERDFASDIDRLRQADLNALHQVVTIGGPPRDDVPALDDFYTATPVGDLLPGEGASATDTLMILYTSGSSSRPKAVPLDHFATIENGFNIARRQGLRRDDRVLVSVPLFWAYGAVNALPAVFSHGATMVLQGHFEPAGALDLIERHNCTAIYTLPAITNALVAHPTFRSERTATLRTGVTIGSPKDIEKAVDQLGAAEMCNVYGQTESYGNCCVTPHDWPLNRRARCQGPPLPGVQMRVRNLETGDLAISGEVGAIEVKGYLTRGYEGQSSKFNVETFTADGFFRTGDLGALDADGTLCFAGRSSEMIKRSGINVSPVEVEEVLQRHRDVGLAGVTGIVNDERGEIIVAFVTAGSSATVDRDSIMAHCKEQLSRYKVPDKLIVTDALPLTVTGKVMRRELKSMAAALDQETAAEGIQEITDAGIAVSRTG